MNSLFPEEILDKVRQSKVIAVVVIDDAMQAVNLANALLDGGITSIELTLRTPAAFESLAAIRKACPEMLTGLGTVISPDQVKRAVDGQADFAVSPGMNPIIVKACKEAGLPFAPGIMTPSDIEGAASLGCRLLKYFPAESLGGISHLKSMAGPYAHLNLEYIPLGGLNLENFTDYLQLDTIPAVGGSWVAPRPLIQARDWKTITANAQAAMTALDR